MLTKIKLKDFIDEFNDYEVSFSGNRLVIKDSKLEDSDLMITFKGVEDGDINLDTEHCHGMISHLLNILNATIPNDPRIEMLKDCNDKFSNLTSEFFLEQNDVISL